MDRALRVLHLEDDAGDAGLVRDVLELGGITCDITRVQTREDFVASLEKGGLDLILADYSLPSFDGMSALKIAAQQSPDVPFIFVSGMLGEELAIEALKLGATDYVLKERLSRIVSAVRGALREAQYRADRKQAEQALRASEERFRTLVQFSFDVYWETDAQHRFIRQDFAVAQPTGPEIGKTRWEVPYLEPDEEAWRKHRATLDAHLPFRDLELARPTPDGGERYFSISGLPVFDETGRFVGYRGVSHDITERKLAEEERRAHLRFLESMDRVNRAMQGTNDLERMMSDVLDAVLELFDCDRAWLIYPCDPEAASWRAVMEHTQPQFPGAFALGTDLPIDAETAAVFRAARASSGALRFGPGYDLQLPASAAERFSIRSQIAMAVYPKVDQAYLFGLHQCSRQRVWTAQEKRLFEEIGRRLADALTSLLVFRTLSESERKLEAAQRIAHVGYWERDFVKGSVALSDETRQLFGGATDLRQFDERALERVHPEDRSKFAEAFTAALRGGPPYDLEYRVVRPDGALRIVHSQGGYVTRDESGRPVRMFGAIQDITELRRAEEELRASEARFRTFVEGATDAFFLHDERLYIVDVNRQACESLGYGREELIGMHPRDFDVGLDAQTFAELETRTAAGERVTFETLHRRRDGTVFPVEIRAHRFQQDERFMRLAFVRDISERKEAEERYRATAELLQRVMASISDYLWSGEVDDQGQWKYNYYSPMVERITGRPPSFYLEGPDRWLETVHPEDRAICLEAFKKLATGQSPREEGEYRIVLPDGKVRWTRDSATLTRLSPPRFRIDGVVSDINERKLAEQRTLAQHTVAQILADAATMEEATPRIVQAVCECLDGDLGAFWRFDRDAGVLRCAYVWRQPSIGGAQFEAVSRSSSFERGRGLPGQVWASRAPACIADVAHDPGFLRAREAERDGLHAAFAFPILLVNEVFGVIEFLSRYVREPDRELLDMMSGLGSQIGQFVERKRAEDALRAAQAELAHVARLITMGELTATIAHEVNQPLAAMVTSASSCSRWLAADPPNLERARRALERIVKDGTRASSVIERVRTLIKREPRRTEPVDLNHVVREVIAMTRSEVQRSGVSIKTRLVEDLPSITGDRVQLQQVILNLMLNAIEATGEVRDRPRQVWLVSRWEGANEVHVEVRDTGTGFAADAAKHLFQTFYTTKKSGLGMGLSISKSIVEAHGGRMAARSNQPHGAILRVSLPITSGV